VRRVLGVALVLVAGCGGREAVVATPTPTAARTALPTPALPPSQRVHFKASDGEEVSAQYTPAADGAPTIVLLHEINGRGLQWDALVPDLHAAGYATLAYDSRSSPFTGERVKDTLGALRWVRRRGGSEIALVGASIGASTTVLTMAKDPRPRAAVALSPVEAPEIRALQERARYHPHDLLLVSDADERAAPAAMLDGARRSKTMLSEHAGHGVDLLGQPGVRAALLGWLRARLS
jgi:alpha-beta hydrolase superfamily lysophospholipase